MLDSIVSFLFARANIIWFVIAMPAFWGIAIWLFRKRHIPRLVLVVASSVLNLLFAAALYTSDGFFSIFPFASEGLEFAVRVYPFLEMFLIFVAAGFLLIALYSAAFLKDRKYAGRFLVYLYISLAMINGALLSDNMGVMLFFWEGLLCTLFAFLLIGRKKNPKTAVKALMLNGIADILLMIGIIIAISQAGTACISRMPKLPVAGISGLSFAFMMLGAIGKAGCMPFHSWIPNAAEDAPTPFMAAFPAALEKFLGIYLAARIIVDIFDFQPGSGMSIAVMTIGTVTIVLAVGMALIQKDMKRLLSYHAISQVGYMVLGLGTALPIGIAGGVFHMLNHVIYKSCLFMTAGSVEKQTGTTNLEKISGLGKAMPVTMACFVISGLAISGVPPLNGFFSKELVFDAVLSSNPVFYIGALLGAFLTAVSFLKLGRAAFFGDWKAPRGRDTVRESGFGMLLPMCVMAAMCILFGLVNALPLDNMICPTLRITEALSGWPQTGVLVLISVAALLLAVCDHIYGSGKSGGAVNAADHIYTGRRRRGFWIRIPG